MASDASGEVKIDEKKLRDEVRSLLLDRFKIDENINYFIAELLKNTNKTQYIDAIEKNSYLNCNFTRGDLNGSYYEAIVYGKGAKMYPTIREFVLKKDRAPISVKDTAPPTSVKATSTVKLGGVNKTKKKTNAKNNKKPKKKTIKFAK
jgi:hypothetical protein